MQGLKISSIFVRQMQYTFIYLITYLGGHGSEPEHIACDIFISLEIGWASEAVIGPLPIASDSWSSWQTYGRWTSDCIHIGRFGKDQEGTATSQFATEREEEGNLETQENMYRLRLTL